MRTVRHYQLTVDCPLTLPVGAETVGVVSVQGTPTLVLLIDTEAELCKRRFLLYHFEHRIPKDLVLRPLGNFEYKGEWWAAFEDITRESAI